MFIVLNSSGYLLMENVDAALQLLLFYCVFLSFLAELIHFSGQFFQFLFQAVIFYFRLLIGIFIFFQILFRHFRFFPKFFQKPAGIGMLQQK